jgi:mannobiose 2-epimerase
MTRIFKPFTFINMIIFSALLNVSGQGKPADLTAIAGEMKDLLLKNMMPVWYPRVIDKEYGGYLSDFNYKWEMTKNQNKMIVTQGRHVWTCSKMKAFTGDLVYHEYARHGYLFLRDFMWDKQYGGFFNLVTREGKPVNEGNDKDIPKNAYGNAFAIYGLAAYYRESGEQGALDLAKDAFRWLEKGSHDAVYGGYFQFLHQDGSPIKAGGPRGIPPKDQNSSIHILEALTELYQVWPDELLRKRLDEMLHLIRDVIVSERGSLHLYLNENLTPVSYQDSSKQIHQKRYFLDHMSFGHDVETAYLLMEASEALNHEADKKTLETGKKMVDNAMLNGWDNSNAGVYDAGYFYKNEKNVTILRDTKNWWAQAETLNTLLIMSELYPDDPMNYRKRFADQWKFIKDYLIDWENGDWYSGSLDKEPKMKNGTKSNIWKGSYHTSRSLMNCINRIREMKKEGKI